MFKKGKIKKFRCRELRDLLDFLRLDSVGLKPILLDRAVRSVEDKSYLNDGILQEDFDEKINELFECTKIPMRKSIEKRIHPIENFRMCVNAKTLIPGRRFDLKRGKQIIEFTLSPNSVYLITNGRREDDTSKFEVLLTVWNYNTDEDWEDISLCVEVNNNLLDMLLPSQHIIYLTSLCDVRESVSNIIVISSAEPKILSNFAFSISVVKRLLPKEMLSLNAPPNVYTDTKSLVLEYFKEHTDRKYVLNLACPTKNQVITYPCRSSLCTHPEVFDLLSFLDDMQYRLQWKCPVCLKRITYDDLLFDKYLHTYLEYGKKAFIFYKARDLSFNREETDAEVICEAEIIKID